MRANAIRHPQTQRDALRMLSQAKGSPFDSIRRRQTPGTVLDFPDTEEVTGSNPVRPTRSQRYSPRNTGFPALRSVGPQARFGIRQAAASVPSPSPGSWFS